MAIIFAITHSILISIGNLLLKKSYEEISPAVEFLIFALISAAIWIPAAIFFPLNQELMLQGLLIGFISALLAQASYIYVISKGELSITGTILATYPIYTVISSQIIFGETITQTQSFFVGLTILGTLIVAYPERFDITSLGNNKYIVWPLLAALAIGFSDALSNDFIDQAGAGTFLIGAGIGHLPIALAYYYFSKEKVGNFTKVFKNLSKYKFAVLSVLFISIGTLSLFSGFEFGDASIVSPISSTFPVFTVLLALAFLKERISLKDAIGVAIVIAGIIGISII